MRKVIVAAIAAVLLAAPAAVAADPSAPSALAQGLFYPAIPGATNPAVTQANIKQTICVKGWTATVRPPTSYTEPMKKKLMGAAGIPWSQSKSYELDHHAPLEAGGNPSSPDNLALQSYVSQPFNAHKKDKLENFAHVEICRGKMTLDEAQALFINTDWRRAYCHYFKDTACASLR